MAPVQNTFDGAEMYVFVVSKHAVSLPVLADGGLVSLWEFYSRKLDSYKSSNRN